MAFIEATLLSPFQKVQTACKMERGGFGSMKQNKYDDPTFFANFSQMARYWAIDLPKVKLSLEAIKW
jgi:hypothetical protein